MRIAAIEGYIIHVAGPSRAYWATHLPITPANELFVRVRTDTGAVGIGMSGGRAVLQGAARVLKDGLADLALGLDPLRPELVWTRLFEATYSRFGRERGWAVAEVLLAASALDIACWDLVGRAAGLPLYRLWGGYRDRVPVYVTGGYYREGKDLSELKEEMAAYRAHGHRAVKMAVGGLSLAEDLKRVQVAREALGPAVALMVDAHRSWDLPTALAGARELRSYDVRWLEDPLRWDLDLDALKRLAARSEIPLAVGHNEPTVRACRALVESGAVGVVQYASRIGGLSQARKVIALAELFGVGFVPQHDPQFFMHLVASSPAGLMVETHDDPVRDPLWFEFFSVSARDVVGGELPLPERGGLGVEVDEGVLARFGTRVL